MKITESLFPALGHQSVVAECHNIWEFTEKLFMARDCHSLLWPKVTIFENPQDYNIVSVLWSARVLGAAAAATATTAATSAAAAVAAAFTATDECCHFNIEAFILYNSILSIFTHYYTLSLWRPYGHTLQRDLNWKCVFLRVLYFLFWNLKKKSGHFLRRSP